jgi:hypothetical protein
MLAAKSEVNERRYFMAARLVVEDEYQPKSSSAQTVCQSARRQLRSGYSRIFVFSCHRCGGPLGATITML